MITVIAGKSSECREGDEKFLFVQHDLQHAPELLAASTIESSLSLAPSRTLACWLHCLVRSGRLSMNHSMRRLKPGSAIQQPRLKGFDRE